MNENINLTKILKHCPEGTKLYSTIYGEVEFCRIDENDDYPIKFMTGIESIDSGVTADGKHYAECGGECTIFPSKEQRDWSKFTAPWYKKENKKERFEPKTLKPFDRVCIRNYCNLEWSCDFFSYIAQEDEFPYVCIGSEWTYCIPYNEETKHLVGTTNEAPEYYRYWDSETKI